MKIEKLIGDIDNIRNRMLKKTNSVNTYCIVKDFSGTYIDKDEKLRYPYFRAFYAAKIDKKRKLNIDKAQEYDIYCDSLLDYGSIIGYKLSKNWSEFNRLISLHLPACLNNCWHCYLPDELYRNEDKNRYFEINAEDIVSKFLDQREFDNEINIKSNVLRITGGEPFLFPEIILECLEELKNHNLHNDVFLWTETNLLPFIGPTDKSFMDREDNKNILREIAKHQNIAIHPCFHGLSDEEIKTITGTPYKISLQDELQALKRIYDYNIDIYPTIGSNVTNPNNLQAFFTGLIEIDKSLPFKIALINYDLNYEPISNRIKSIDSKKRELSFYSRFSVLRIWNQLMLDKYGIGYGVIPRHIKMENLQCLSNPNKTYEASEPILYLFKASFSDSYHREMLDILALPNETLYKIEYDKKWVDENLYEFMKSLRYKYPGTKGILNYVFNKDSDTKYFPVRYFTIIQIEDSGRNYFTLLMKLNDLISYNNETSTDVLKSINRKYLGYFGSRNLPPKNKYVLFGESFKIIPTPSVDKSKKTTRDDFKNVVERLISEEKMNQSLFYRIITSDLMLKEKNGRTVYEIKSGDSFKIKVEWNLPNYDFFKDQNNEKITILFKSSSDNIKPITNNKITLSKYDYVEIIFNTEKVDKNEEVTLIFYAPENENRAAKIELIIDLIPKRIKNASKSLIAAISLSTTIFLSQILYNIASSTPEKKILDWEQIIENFSNNWKLLIPTFIGAMSFLWFTFYLFYRGVKTKID